ncbi:MarR family winged helix-turn-helix transcriptional regulator [Streptomyces sp. NPDC007063]|uniref:MarR family winged helix-turn-helix transcriptional regulator n=1 Tax=Streptomyces sp. NPDC007063 TaxID=3364772 RepID=UPI0036CA5AB4
MDATKPIDYWLKHLHDLLERQFDATLADLDVGRRHWQVLNTLSHGPASREEVIRALAPFREAGAVEPAEILDGPGNSLAARGWTTAAGRHIDLTPEGRAAHARIADRVARTRRTVLGGLTPEQYTATVHTLSVMAANVEADLASGGRPA